MHKPSQKSIDSLRNIQHHSAQLQSSADKPDRFVSRMLGKVKNHENGKSTQFMQQKRPEDEQQSIQINREGNSDEFKLYE